MRFWHHRYRDIYLGASIGAVVALLLTWFVLPRQYASNATLVFPLPSGGDSPLAGMRDMGLGRFATPSDDQFPLSTYEAVLNSRELATRVAKREKLGEIYQLDDPDVVAQTAESWLSARVNVADRTLTVEAVLPGTPRMKGLGDILNRGASNARDRIYRELTASCCRSMIVELDEMSSEIKLDRSKARMQDLERELAKAKTGLSQMQQDAVELAWKTDGSVERLGDQLGEQLSSVDGARLQARVDLNATERRIATVKQQLSQNLAEVDKLPAELEFLQEARQGVRNAEAQYEQLIQAYGDENATVAKALLEVRLSRENLQRQMQAASSGLTEELQQLVATRDELRARLSTVSAEGAKIQGRLAEMPEMMLLATRAKQAVELQTKVVNNLEQELLSARMEYEQHGIKWSILDPPLVPLRKLSPSTIKNIVLGLLFGSLLLGRIGWYRLIVDTIERPNSQPDSRVGNNVAGGSPA